MSRTLPPIFLLVAAFLINLTLSRVVALERELIGLLKAVGYRNGTIAFHYLKFVGVVAAIGIIIGSAAGTWLGMGITQFYAEVFRLPFLVFVQSPDLHVIAAALSLIAATLGALRALRQIVLLPPAIAMQPPNPQPFRRLLPANFSRRNVLTQPMLMMIRNIVSHPVRAAFTTLGLALATGILIASLFLQDTMENIIDVTYFLSDRQDATVSFIEKHSENTVLQIARLPGVLAVEPFREVPVRIRHENLERRVMISGRPRNPDLSRIIDVDLHPVRLPENGLAISGWLAQLLGVRSGDYVEIDLLEGQRRTVWLPVTALVEDYFGIQGIMDSEALARLMREAQAVNGVFVSLDSNKSDLFYDAIKRLPSVAGTVLQRISLANFREQIATIVSTMGTLYTGLAVVIGFGVVYNSARISLSERARELASLRVLGFTQGEVLRILFLELALLTLLSQPAGWAIGYGLAWTLKTNMAADVMRARLVVGNFTYALASGIVIAGSLASALIVRRRLNRLDLVTVLKTRD